MSHWTTSGLLVYLLLGSEVAAIQNVLRDLPDVVHVDGVSTMVDLLVLPIERSGRPECLFRVIGDGDVLPGVEAVLGVGEILVHGDGKGLEDAFLRDTGEEACEVCDLHVHVCVVVVHERVQVLEDLVRVVLLQCLGKRDVHDVGEDLGDRGKELLGEVLGERDDGPRLDEALLALGKDVGHRDFGSASWVDAPGVSCLDALG